MPTSAAIGVLVYVAMLCLATTVPLRSTAVFPVAMLLLLPDMSLNAVLVLARGFQLRSLWRCALCSATTRLSRDQEVSMQRGIPNLTGMPAIRNANAILKRFKQQSMRIGSLRERLPLFLHWAWIRLTAPDALGRTISVVC
eukprot:Rmarinus@m.2079